MTQPTLSNAELAAMRATVQAPLPDTAQIQRRTIVNDGEGGSAVTWAVVATIPCRVGVVGATGGQTSEEVIGDRIAARSGILLTFAYDADIRSEDRVIVSGRTLEVIEPLAHSWQMGLQAIAKDVS